MLVLHFVGSWDSAQHPVGSSRLRGRVGRDPQTGRGPTQLPIGRPVLRGEPLPTSGLSPLWDSPCECGCSDPPKLPTHSYNGSGGLRGHAWALPVRWHGNSKPQCGLSWGSPRLSPLPGVPVLGRVSFVFVPGGREWQGLPSPSGAQRPHGVRLPRLCPPAAGTVPGARRTLDVRRGREETGPRAPRRGGKALGTRLGQRPPPRPLPREPRPFSRTLETSGLANAFMQRP